MQTINQIRAELKYSIREMAETLGLSASTLQCYDNGSRLTPPQVLEAAQAELTRCREFSKQYLPGGELDIIMQDVKPFMSERVAE